MACDADALDAVLRRFPAGVRLAVEPRDPSCSSPPSAGCWSVAPPRSAWPTAPAWSRPNGARRTGATCASTRAGAAPRPCYGRAALATWARRLADRYSPGDDVFAFFNNDTEGCAPRDARRFAARVAAEGLAATRVPGARETPVGGSA
jgi:uncharacterized protein YecE (DUF72 family)